MNHNPKCPFVTHDKWVRKITPSNKRKLLISYSTVRVTQNHGTLNKAKPKHKFYLPYASKLQIYDYQQIWRLTPCIQTAHDTINVHIIRNWLQHWQKNAFCQGGFVEIFGNPCLSGKWFMSVNLDSQAGRCKTPWAFG